MPQVVAHGGQFGSTLQRVSRMRMPHPMRGGPAQLLGESRTVLADYFGGRSKEALHDGPQACPVDGGLSRKAGHQRCCWLPLRGRGRQAPLHEVAIQRRTGITSNLSTFAGLIRREPALAWLMTLFLLSLTGIPPTAGFFGKFYVILAAVQAGHVNPWLNALAILAVMNAAAAAFYYLRVVVYMFMRDPDTEVSVASHGRLVWTGLAVTTVMTIALGLFPGVLLNLVSTAAGVFKG